jgi:hypothetical protein
MSKEKQNNFFGKRKPAGKLVENFYVSQEEGNMRVKIEHKSGDFNFRLWCGEQVGMWYERFTKGEMSRAYSEIFSGIKVFTIMAIQNPEFYRDYSLWANDYFDAKQKVTTDAESEKIIDEMRAEYSDNEKLKDGLNGTETNGAGSKDGAGGECDNDTIEGDGAIRGENN